MHTPEYVDAFTSGTLDDARIKRIGFGAEVTRSPVLIERTLAEVAGIPLSRALLALSAHNTPSKAHLGCEQEYHSSSLMLCAHNASACVNVKVDTRVIRCIPGVLQGRC